LADYTDMTDEEYDALGEELTRMTPKLGPNSTGFLSQRQMRLLGFTNTSVNYLLTKALADHKSPAHIIDEIICERIAVSANQSMVRDMGMLNT